MGKVRRALKDGKLSRSEAKSLNANQLERAIDRVESSAGALTIGGGVQNYASNNQMPRIANRIAAINTGGSPGTGGSPSSRGSSGTGANTQSSGPAAPNAYMGTPESRYIRTADMYGMGGADQGVFSGASWNQMSADGYSDDQIRDYLKGMEGSGLMIGKRVQDVLDNYDTYKMPTVPDMPGMTDPRSGDEINPSYASPAQIFFSPVNTDGVNNMWGNPLGNGINTFSVVGDGKDFTSLEGIASIDRSPAAMRRQLNSGYAMSQANPGVVNNQAAFVDSGHVESLLSGSTPGQLDMYGSITPWSQAYDQQLAYQGNWQMPGGSGKKGKR